MARIVVVGSVNLDLVARVPRLPEPGETLAAHELRRVPGGKGANQALAARRLGADVALVAAVGADPAADEALELLRAEGVDLSGVTAHPGCPPATPSSRSTTAARPRSSSPRAPTTRWRRRAGARRRRAHRAGGARPRRRDGRGAGHRHVRAQRRARPGRWRGRCWRGPTWSWSTGPSTRNRKFIKHTRPLAVTLGGEGAEYGGAARWWPGHLSRPPRSSTARARATVFFSPHRRPARRTAPTRTRCATPAPQGALAVPRPAAQPALPWAAELER